MAGARDTAYETPGSWTWRLQKSTLNLFGSGCLQVNINEECKTTWYALEQRHGLPEEIKLHRGGGAGALGKGYRNAEKDAGRDGVWRMPGHRSAKDLSDFYSGYKSQESECFLETGIQGCLAFQQATHSIMKGFPWHVKRLVSNL